MTDFSEFSEKDMDECFDSTTILLTLPMVSPGYHTLPIGLF